MKFCALSDLHGNLIDYIEPCDVVIIAGDIFPMNIQSNTLKSAEWFCQKFIPWAESLPCFRTIFIAGNHDFLLEKLSEYEIMDVLPPKVVYLKDDIYNYHGVIIYGTPWCVNLEKWAFYTKDEKEFNNIPKCDILISHQPPMVGSVGTVHQPGYNYMNTFASENLANNIKKVKPKYVLSGHIHTGNHVPDMIDETIYVNVSILDEDYKIKYYPFYFEYEMENSSLNMKTKNLSKDPVKLKEEKLEDNNLYKKILP